MPFEVYLTAPFEHRHENEMFNALAEILQKEFRDHPEPHKLIGNLLFENENVDAILIKPDGICVVEMKNYGGMIHFSENGPWFADEVEVKGNSRGNPYRQVRSGRFRLINHLNKRQQDFLKSRNTPNWGHVSCLLLFGKRIHFDEKLPEAISKWFHICDLSAVGSILGRLSSNQLRLSHNEQARLVEVLGIRESQRYSREKTVPSEAKFQRTLTNLQIEIHEAGTIFGRLHALNRINVELFKSALLSVN
jgi:hypothetical protein